MVERGGSTTQASIYYQNSVSALHLGRMCDATPRHPNDSIHRESSSYSLQVST
jgi:hypothetical protein